MFRIRHWWGRTARRLQRAMHELWWWHVEERLLRWRDLREHRWQRRARERGVRLFTVRRDGDRRYQRERRAQEETALAKGVRIFPAHGERRYRRGVVRRSGYDRRLGAAERNIRALDLVESWLNDPLKRGTPDE